MKKVSNIENNIVDYGGAAEYYFEDCKKYIEQYSDNTVFTDINDVLELYNIKCIMERNISSNNIRWSSLDPNKTVIKSFNKQIGTFFSKINKENIDDFYSKVDSNYQDTFWCLFEKYQKYKDFDNKFFISFIDKNDVWISLILQRKTLVGYYNEELKNYLIHKPNIGEYIVKEFLEKKDSNSATFFFPKSLSPEEKEKLIQSYINSDHPNLNYLKLIYESQSCSELPLSDKTRLNAKTRYNQIAKELFSDSIGIEYGVQITFSEDMKNDLVQLKIENRVEKYTFNKKWIEDNEDYPTLLNNFIYMFGFVDCDFISTSPSFNNDLGIFERIKVTGVKEYPIGIAFKNQFNKTILCIKAYHNLLMANDIYLENIIKWFFEEYLSKEFNSIGWTYNASKIDSSYLEKNKNIVSEIDSVLKQFRMICEDGIINRELFEMSSEHIFFDKISSLLPNKYVYQNSTDICKEMNLLFSDQCLLMYSKSEKKSYKSFYNRMVESNVNIDGLEEFQMKDVEWLLSRNTLKISNKILTPNKKRCKLLYDLYRRGVFCPYYHPSIQQTLDELVRRNEIIYDKKLFCKQEVAFLNFILNKAQFSNGIDLRNKYSHGTYSKNINEHERDYWCLLSIMILIIIKINEEFCLKYPK